MVNDDWRTGDLPRERPGQFSLRLLLLLPVAIALPFGVAHLADNPAVGILAALVELLVGALYPSTRRAVLVGIGLVLVIGLLFGHWLLSSGHPRSEYRTVQCGLNLKWITLALHNYHDTYGSFPPAYVADSEGRPMHSWRVLLLPFIGERELYRQYRFDEPWNSPNNLQIAESMPDMFRCPSEPVQSLDANYFLVTGNGSAWGDGKAPEFSDFTDGTSKTIILVEVASSGVRWTEPRDVDISQAMAGINSGVAMGISGLHSLRPGTERPESAHVAYADGSVGILKNDFPRSELHKLLTHQGGEAVKKP